MIMVYIVMTAWYPTYKWKEVGTKFLEVLQKFKLDRNLGKIIIPAMDKRTKKGIKAITIIEPKADKVGEVLNLLAQASMLYKDIEGHECEIEIYASAAEGMSLAGFKTLTEKK